MDSNEQALNTFLGSRNAFVAMSVKGDGGSYLSWIKSQYKQEEPVHLEDIASWKEDYEASNVSSQAASTLTANAQVTTPEDREEVPSLELSNPKNFGGNMSSPRLVKVDNFYVDGELDGEPEMCFYVPSGVATLHLGTPPAAGVDDVEGGDQEDGSDDGGDEGHESIVLNDGTVMLDLDIDDEGQHDTPNKDQHAALHNHVHTSEDHIETLMFSDESDSDSDSERVAPADGAKVKSPEQWLQALAEIRLMNPRYRTITDAELLTTLQGRQLVLTDEGAARESASNCAACRRAVGSCVGACTACFPSVETTTRWYEDVHEFEVFDEDHS